MVKKNRNDEIILLAKSGKTLLDIAKQFGITKTRVGQIIKKSNIDPRTVRRNERIERLLKIKVEAEKQLKFGLKIGEIRKKLKIDTNTYTQLKELGLNLSLVDKEGINKRRKLVTKLFKSGKTAYEIIDELPILKTPDKVYSDVCKLNNGHLFKRKSTYNKRSENLTKKIKTLKTKYSFSKVCEILNQEGVTNVNGNKIKIGLLYYHYYQK
jgi:DNA-binding CsgD family transcriptional regulator